MNIKKADLQSIKTAIKGLINTNDAGSLNTSIMYKNDEAIQVINNLATSKHDSKISTSEYRSSLIRIREPDVVVYMLIFCSTEPTMHQQEFLLCLTETVDEYLLISSIINRKNPKKYNSNIKSVKPFLDETRYSKKYFPFTSPLSDNWWLPLENKGEATSKRSI